MVRGRVSRILDNGLKATMVPLERVTRAVYEILKAQQEFDWPMEWQIYRRVDFSRLRRQPSSRINR